MVGGATQDFSLANSTVSGSTATPGGTVSMDLYLSTDKTGTGTWAGKPGHAGCRRRLVHRLQLPPGDHRRGPDHAEQHLRVAQLQRKAPPRRHASVETTGLAAGCYRFNLRATARTAMASRSCTFQPVTFNVATTSSNGCYVDIIGFAVFEVTDVGAN